jgi:hypothetical protein
MSGLGKIVLRRHRQCRDTVGRSRRFSLHPHQAEKSALQTLVQTAANDRVEPTPEVL